MVEREAFLTKSKNQWHLSQWVEWAYGTQSCKERRLLCEFIFILIDKQNFDSKKWLEEGLFL